jgi:ArsR family transcriptional regulator
MMSLTTPDVCCPELLPGLPDEDDAKDLAEKFKALGDPVRLRLMTLVATHPDGEVCVCEMTSHFQVTMATISYHLKVLRTAGLIMGDRRGTWVYYRATPDALHRLAHVLGQPDLVPLGSS